MPGVSSIIVLEESTRFRRELETQWLRCDVGVRRVVGAIESAASVSEVMDRVGATWGGMVLADLSVGQPAVLRLLECWDRPWPIVVVGMPVMAELEWPLRELGATAVLFEPVNPSRLWRMCERVLEGAA